MRAPRKPAPKKPALDDLIPKTIKRDPEKFKELMKKVEADLHKCSHSTDASRFKNKTRLIDKH